ncbi:MAG: hypothetical protein MI746_11525 [Pseudomonadales bacterium]|nr:hypothetical protein [Pseudomonadales bacterium]
MQSINFIAILGFAKQVNERQALLAEEAARKLSESGHGVGVGNVTGTFSHALKSAKENKGLTMAIIEQTLRDRNLSDCDILQIVSTQRAKHEALAKQCSGALVIGGGTGTLKLIEQFLRNGKRVVAIADSGGIVPRELGNSVTISSDMDAALRTLMH